MKAARVPRMLALAASLALLATPSARVEAGATLTAPVFTSTVSRVARGSVADARSSADRAVYIGCQLRTLSSGPEVSCKARRSSLVAGVSCTLTPANDQNRFGSFVIALTAMSSSAHIEFTWDASGRCRTLKVSNDSRYAPKRP